MDNWISEKNMFHVLFRWRFSINPRKKEKFLLFLSNGKTFLCFVFSHGSNSINFAPNRLSFGVRHEHWLKLLAVLLSVCGVAWIAPYRCWFILPYIGRWRCSAKSWRESLVCCLVWFVAPPLPPADPPAELQPTVLSVNYPSPQEHNCQHRR